MRPLRDRSIRQKIMAVIMLVAGAALLVACTVVFAFQSWTIEKRFVSELAVSGQMVANNVAVAAMLKDAEKANQVLDSLRALPQIVFAGVVLNDGIRLAQFGKMGVPEMELAAPAMSAARTKGRRLFISEPLMWGGQRHGTLFLHADFRDSYLELLKLYGSIIAIALAASLLLTYLLSERLQNWVTSPILRLANTARRIADENDYSVRAEKTGGDEVGTLTDAFNQMLTQIHAQDTDLQNAQSKLREQLSELELEVSERRAAEEALRESQEKLLQTSRLAGMAEVATSLLHNVGNVLNSVNVSGNVLNERLRGSKIAALSRVSALINQHRTDFSAFVTHDPRGKKIPELVSTLNDALVEEHDDLLAEVGVISKHIGHIKEIVAMQQNYSRVGGLIERVAVEDLLEDALRMNTVSMLSKQFQITQDYEPVPKVEIDRHKVLQILVNLLNNARHAMENSGRADKQLILRVRKCGEQFVEISVEDNGVGIAPENLTRIFAHGFTTKKSGNGYGLHCGALAASEIGGALWVHSDGIGKGATFTLKLPVTALSGVALAN